MDKKTINIIKLGVIHGAKIEEFKTSECEYCHTIFEYIPSEYRVHTLQTGRELLYMKCPLCGRDYCIDV